MKDRQFCNDYGDAPSCSKFIDEKYTMDFGHHGKIFWCASCGPKAHEMQSALTKAFSERGPEFVKEFSDAVNEAEQSRVKH